MTQVNHTKVWCTFKFIIYIYSVCGTGTGDCCGMKKCYKSVVVVKVAPAVVWMNATILLLLWRWRLLLYERVLQYCCCCEGGDCCCMNECYNIVVVVKVATAVLWTSATILLLLWRWRLLLYERMLQYCCCCEGGDCCCMNECYNIVVVVKVAISD